MHDPHTARPPCCSLPRGTPIPPPQPTQPGSIIEFAEAGDGTEYPRIVFQLAARFIAQRGVRGGWESGQHTALKGIQKRSARCRRFFSQSQHEGVHPKACGRQARVHRAGRHGLTTGFRDEVEASGRSGMAAGPFDSAGGSCGKRGQSESDDDHITCAS